MKPGDLVVMKNKQFNQEYGLVIEVRTYPQFTSGESENGKIIYKAVVMWKNIKYGLGYSCEKFGDLEVISESR